MLRHNILRTWSTIGAIGLLAATACHSSALEEYRKYMGVKGIGKHFETQTRSLPKLSMSYRQAMSDTGVWSIPFSPKGVFGFAQAMDVDNGKIAVGGGVRGADGIAVDGIALWDGSQWTSASTGLGGIQGVIPIVRIHLSGEKIYALGYLHLTLDGRSVDAVHWNGSTWTGWKLDTGMVAYDIIHWNGQTLLATSSGIWEADDSGLKKIASNLNGKAVQFESKGSQLWVAGEFRLEPDTVTVNYASWTGSAWTGLPPPGPRPPRSYSLPFDFTWHGEELFAIEAFTEMGNSGLDWSIMRWNGSNWTALPIDPEISQFADIESDQESLYLTSLKGEIAILEKWDGDRFQVHSTFRSPYAYLTGLELDAQKLYISGPFNGIGPVRADGVAMLDGTRWYPLSKSENPGPSFSAGSDGVPALATDGRRLYFGSHSLYYSGEKPAGGFSAWDGQTLDILGAGLKTGRGLQPSSMRVNTIVIQEGKVYVGGSFDSAGANAARNIAVWDGSSWQSLGAGYPGSVNDIFPSRSNLLVCGSPDYELQPGSNEAIARQTLVLWNGSDWRSFGGPITGQVRKIFNYKDELHIGGLFRLPDDTVDCALARRTGDSWIPIIRQTNRNDFKSLNSIVVHDGDLYLAGLFKDTASEDYYGLARWNGSTLSGFDSVKSIGFGAQALLSYQSKLFLTGSLKGRDDALIYWDGSQWHTVLDQSIQDVFALMEFRGDMYVYGNIPRFDGKCANNLLRWGSPNSNLALPYFQANRGAGRQLLFQGGVPGFVSKFNGKNFDLRGRVLTYSAFR